MVRIKIKTKRVLNKNYLNGKNKKRNKASYAEK
jgi:hypothetical protein